jgi:uncharacterized protein
VQAGDRITVKVLEVDLDRKRISLTARKDGGKTAPAKGAAPQRPQQNKPPQRQPPRGFSANPFAGL